MFLIKLTERKQWCWNMTDVYDIRAMDIDGKLYFRVLFEIGGKHVVLPANMDFYFEIPKKEQERIEEQLPLYDWSNEMVVLDRGWIDTEGNQLVSVKYISYEQKNLFIKTFDDINYNNVDVSEERQWMHHHGHEYGDFMKKPLYFDIETDPTDMNRKWASGDAVIKFSNRVLMVGMATPNGKEYPFIDDDERKMLRVAFATAKKHSVLIGWNSGGYQKSFDLPYLQGRSELLGLKLPWEKLPNLCMMHGYKDYMKFKKELGEVVHLGLDDAGEKFLGYGKTEKNYHKLIGWFMEDRMSLETYCMNDVFLMLDLAKKVEGLADGFNVEVIKRKLATLEPNERYVSSFVDSKFNDFSFEMKLGVPPKGKWIHRDPGKICPVCEYLHVGDFDVEKCLGCGADIKKTGAGGFVSAPSPGLSFNTIFVDYQCYSEDTEMLTNKGWMSLEDFISKREEDITLATLNLKNSMIEYQKMTDLYHYDYDGEMYHFSNNHSYDVLVTPNHRMVFHKRDRKGGRKLVNSFMRWDDNYVIDEAQNMKDYWYAIPNFGIWQGEERIIDIGEFSFVAKQFLPFFGWFLSDGTINEDSIIVSQKKEHNFSNIENAFIMLGLKYKINTYERETKFCIHNRKFVRAFYNWMDGRCTSYDKHIPREILALDVSSLRSLFNSLLLGDGSTQFRMQKEVPMNYYSVSRQLIDDVQELALKIGYGCSIVKQIKDENCFGKIYEDYEIYRANFSVNRRNAVSKQRENIKQVFYKGKVWCVSVPNGTVVIRRNGKVVVSGNSLYPTIYMTHNIGVNNVDWDNTGENSITTEELCFFREPRGLNAKFMEWMLVERMKYRAKRDKYVKGTDEYIFNDMYQQAFKDILVSANGVLEQKNFRYKNQKIYNSCTKTGQVYLDILREAGEELGLELTQCDTDGIFFLSPYETVEETIEHLEEIEKHLFDRVKEKAMARWNLPEEFYAIYPRCEKICSHFYSIAKKSYVMKIVYDDGKRVERFDAKGMPGVKYNTLPLLKEILKNIFKEVIFKLPAGADYVDACVDYLLALKDDLYGGRRDDLLMFSQQVDKLGGRNPWDRAAEKLNTMGKFEPGVIIKFLRRKNGSIILPDYEEVEVDLGTYEYYWTGAVAGWIKRLLPVVAGIKELGFQEAMVNDTLAWLGD